MARTPRALEAGLDDETAPVTDGADARHGLEEPFVDALAGHLDQSEFGDVKDLSTGLIAREGLAQCRGDSLAIDLGLHVDEVDHDDAANVAKSQLTRHFFGRFEVVAKNRLFEIRRPDVLAGVDINDGQGLGALNDQRSSGGQEYLAIECPVELLVDEVSLEERELFARAVVVLNTVGQLGIDREHVFADLLVQHSIVDQHAAVIVVELFAQYANREIE